VVCDIKFGLEIISAVSAFAAAIFWFYASWIGFNTSIDDKITVKQARLNAKAALCAGIAAFSQLVVNFMPVCRAFA
jgi:hypothetical protein